MLNYHLTPDGDRWTLMQEGSEALIGNFATKEEAVARCSTHMAQREGSLKIHRVDGTIEEEHIYPNETENRGTTSAASSTAKWIVEHSYPTAGFAFVFGILLGAVLARPKRW